MVAVAVIQWHLDRGTFDLRNVTATISDNTYFATVMYNH